MHRLFFWARVLGMSEEIKQKTGRPASYTPELADIICARIASGETLKGICREAGMPPESTFRTWVTDDRDGLSARYARAMELRIEHMADELLEIADDGANDYIETENGPQLNAEHVQRSRLRVDARKWLMSKLAPKKYGDRVAQEISGPDGGAIKHDLTLTADEAYKRLVDG